MGAGPGRGDAELTEMPSPVCRDKSRKAAPPVSLAGNWRFSAYGISDFRIDNDNSVGGVPGHGLFCTARECVWNAVEHGTVEHQPAARKWLRRQ